MAQETSGVEYGPSSTVAVPSSVRAYFRAIGTGWRTFSSEKRAEVARMTARRRTATMRARYGPSGRRKSPRLPMRIDAIIAEAGGEWPGLYEI